MDPRRLRPAATGAAAVLLTIYGAAATPAAGQSQTHVAGFGFHVFDSRWNDGPFTRVFAGANFTLALRADGSLAAWGLNDALQCRVPATPPGVGYVDVAGGDADACPWGAGVVALRSDGVVVSWGDTPYSPMPAPQPPPGVSYVEVEAAWAAALLRRSDGVVISLQPGGDVLSAVPTTTSPFVEIAAAGWHATGRLADGALISWEADWTGVVNLLPVPPPPVGAAYVEIAAGSGGHDAARLSDGTVVAWGANGDGQSDVPAAPVGTSYVQIACGHRHTLARRSDGAVVAWGWNAAGQCDVPPLPAGLTYVDIAAGASHSVALRSDGSMVAWGDNGSAQCNVPRTPPGVEYVRASVGAVWGECDGYGASQTWLFRSDGTMTSLEFGDAAVPSPPPGTTYAAAAGGGAGYAVRSDGALVVLYGAPAPPTGNVYTGVSAGFDHAAALRTDGFISAWGRNDVGQCNVPGPPVGRRYVGVAANSITAPYDGHTVALLDDGTVVVAGMIGPAPALPPGRKYLQVAAGHGSGLARRDDGVVVAWRHPVPFGPDVDMTPPPLPPGLQYVDLAAGGLHGLARRSDGALVAWGWNVQGQLDAPALPNGFECFAIAAAGGQSVGLFRPVPLAFSQPNGPGSGVIAALAGLVPGHEYFDLFSADLAVDGPGTGPWAGLYFADVGFLIAQLTTPVGGEPFHFVAGSGFVAFGPYALPVGFAFDAVRLDVTGGVLGSVTPVVRYLVD